MEVIDIVDNDDGTATLTFDMTEEEKSILIEYAVQNLLREYIEKEKK